MGDHNIIACRPVNWEEMGVYGNQYEQTPIYADSVEVECESCKLAIWLGPRGAAVKKEHPKVPVLCFLCALAQMQLYQDRTGEEVEVHHLGNTNYKE